jgi:hypothetical protein
MKTVDSLWSAKKAFSHTTLSGFDLVSVFTARHQVLVFEAFHPASQVALDSGQAEVARVCFDKWHNCFLVFHEAGDVRRFDNPIPLEEKFGRANQSRSLDITDFTQRGTTS